MPRATSECSHSASGMATVAWQACCAPERGCPQHRKRRGVPVLYCPLSRLPSPFAHSCDSLSGSLPADLAQCPNIRFVDLSSNQLSGTIPGAWANLSLTREWTTLRLSANRLSGSVPYEMLASNIFMTNLYLDRNSFEGVWWSVGLSAGGTRWVRAWLLCTSRP